MWRFGVAVVVVVEGELSMKFGVAGGRSGDVKLGYR